MYSTSASATDSQAGTDLTLDLPTTIQRYFDALNRGAFEQVAALFAEDGQMVPPFEQPIVGRVAIAQYLSTEARDMSLKPIECEHVTPSIDQTEDQTKKQTNKETTHTDSLQCFLVRGKVKTSLLGVNVAWQFDLNAVDEITKVRIKLLASLQELIKFKH